MKSLFDMHKPMIVAHRGAAGGNIPCNTPEAFETALRMGADVLELDVAFSADRQMFVFHPGMEFVQLGIERRIAQMQGDEVKDLRYLNVDRTPTHCGVEYLDVILEQLKNRCYINIDKFWTGPNEIAECIRRHGMQDQILIKTPAEEQMIRDVERYAPDLPYMLILCEEDHWTEKMLKRPLRYLGAEVVFAHDDAPIAQAAYIEKMHQRGLQVWANGIIYDEKAQLAGGHSDDLSVTQDPDLGWGWLLDLGVDFIQTDWPLALRCYMNQRNMQKK